MAESGDMQDRDVGDIVAKVHKMFREARHHSSEWRTDAQTWYAFTAGDQWDANDLMVLQEQNRPAVTFNRILRTVNAVCGAQINNRHDTQFIPREPGDAQVNELLTAAADWARDNCDAEDEESDAFRDMIICGMGWTETRMDFAADGDGEIRIDRVDPLEMYWDPAARKRNLSDARYFLHVRTYPRDEFEALWPDADIDLAASPWQGDVDQVSSRVHVYPQDAYKEQQSLKGASVTAPIRVAHAQWVEYRRKVRVGRDATTIEASDFEAMREKFDRTGTPYLRQDEAVWKRAFVAGGEVLSEGECPCPHYSTFRPMTAERDRNNGTWFGLVKAMADPQRFGNKFFSQMLDIMNKGSKGGVLVEKGAVDDARELETKWARPDAVITFNAGALTGGKVQPKPVFNMPPAMDAMLGFSLDAVHEVTGVNLEMLGFADRNQPGVLEYQRRQSGLNIIAQFFDSIRRYRKEQGRVLLHFIQEYLPDEQLIRIKSDDGADQFVPLIRGGPGEDVARYDVQVDQSPTSPDQRERVYAALVEVLPTLGKFGVPVPPEVLDYAPLPSKLTQRWKEMIQEQGDIDPEIRARMEEMAAEISELRDKRGQIDSELQLKAMDAQAKQGEAAAAIQLKREQARIDAELKAREFEQKRNQVEAEMALKRWEAEADLDLARRRAEGELLIKMGVQNPENGEIGQEIRQLFMARTLLDRGDVTVDQMRSFFIDDRPKRKIVNVVHGPDGRIAGAEVVEVVEDVQ